MPKRFDETLPAFKFCDASKLTDFNNVTTKTNMSEKSRKSMLRPVTSDYFYNDDQDYQSQSDEYSFYNFKSSSKEPSIDLEKSILQLMEKPRVQVYCNQSPLSRNPKLKARMPSRESC